jgi:hypothetical protein
MFMIELHRQPIPDSGREGFHFPAASWNAMLEMAKGHGWVPMGAIERTPARLGERDFSYCPGSYGWPLPIVQAEDVTGLRSALERLLHELEDLQIDLPYEGPLLVSVGESLEKNAFSNSGITRSLLHDFLGFLEKEGGGFDFAWDD